LPCLSCGCDISIVLSFYIYSLLCVVYLKIIICWDMRSNIRSCIFSFTCSQNIQPNVSLHILYGVSLEFCFQISRLVFQIFTLVLVVLHLLDSSKTILVPAAFSYFSHQLFFLIMYIFFKCVIGGISCDNLNLN
jgi:hypothetical protein